jgi:hypothetical protein
MYALASKQQRATGDSKKQRVEQRASDEPTEVAQDEHHRLSPESNEVDQEAASDEEGELTMLNDARPAANAAAHGGAGGVGGARPGGRDDRAHAYEDNDNHMVGDSDGNGNDNGNGDGDDRDDTDIGGGSDENDR